METSPPGICYSFFSVACLFYCYYSLTALLRYNWHTIDCRYLKCKFKFWHMYELIKTFTTINIVNILSINPGSFLMPLYKSSAHLSGTFLSLQICLNRILHNWLSVTIDLFSSCRILHKCSHTIYSLLSLASFT